MSGHPETLTLSAFAGYLGVAKSYVTKLKHAGRLVLAEDGAVRVAESLARIHDTADPARSSVRQNRPESTDDELKAPPEVDTAGMSYQGARAIRERYLALAARRDYELSCGQLFERARVESYLANAIVTLRTRLEALAPVLGPQLAAETDESRCIALVGDEVERCLQDLERSFRSIDGGE